jgi:hypothetical protein
MGQTTDIKLELDATQITGGETLTGRVRTSPDVDSVRLRTIRERRVDGGETDREAVRQTSEATDAEGTSQFDLEAPTGPYSFSNSTADLDWKLEAVAVADGDERGSAAREFDLQPGDPLERSSDENTATEQRPGLPDSLLGNLLGGITSAFGLPSSVEEIHRSLEYIEPGTGEYERENSLLGNLPLILVALIIGVGGLVGAAGMYTAGQGPFLVGMFSLMGLVFLGIGGWKAYKGARNRMAESAIGEVTVDVHPDELVRGDTLTCTVDFSPERDVELNGVYVDLKCVQIDKQKGRRHVHSHHHHDHDPFDDDDDDSGRSMRTRTYTDTLFSEKLELSGAQRLGPGEPFAVAEQFTVPETSKHSYFHRAPFWARLLPLRGVILSREIEWVVEVHIDIEDWPDWVTEHKCVVYP